MSIKKKNILFIFRNPPYSSNRAQEGIETVLAASVFEQNFSVLFIGEGVLQLIPNQQGQQIERKNILSLLEAFPLYDINNVYVDHHSISEEKFNQFAQIIPIQPMDQQQIIDLINQSDVVLSY